jgi:hypothetical protein
MFPIFSTASRNLCMVVFGAMLAIVIPSSFERKAFRVPEQARSKRTVTHQA